MIYEFLHDRSGEAAPSPTRAGRRRRRRRRRRQPRGTPAGAHVAVGGMGAAIVGTQRRAERSAATGTAGPPIPLSDLAFSPGSGVHRQSARGSRADAGPPMQSGAAGRRRAQAQSSPMAREPGVSQLSRRRSGAAGCRAAHARRRRPRLGARERVQSLEDSTSPGCTPQRARVRDADV